MKTYIHLTNTKQASLPARFQQDDVRFPESLVEYFLEQCTEAGDVVFDPFAGFGTTLFVAERMGRVPYGVEHDGGRQEWVAGQLEHWAHLKRGDAADLLSFGFPKMDFAMTSPPYMPKHHKWNPLYGGDPKHAGYGRYLKRMAFIFGRMKTLMKRNAVFVLQADNLPGKIYTPLVRDLGLAAEKHFRLDGEVIVAWDGGRPDARHTHCLVFRNSR